MFDVVALHPRYQTKDYQWWRYALMRDRRAIHDSDPQCGLYRWRDKPTEIWIDPDLREMCCVAGGELVDMDRCRQEWISISRDPVTPQAFRQAVQTGQWPGGNMLADRVIKEIAQAGHNNPTPEGPEQLKVWLDELERDARRLIEAGPAKSQAEADEAAKLADGIDKVEKEAVKFHADLKAPHLAAGKALDRTWFPIRDRASDLKRSLKAVRITPFLVADKITREAATASLVAQGADPLHITDKAPKAVGNTRTTALRSVKRAVVDDYTVLATHLLEHPDVKDAVLRVANASARAGVTLPGMTIATDQVAV